MRLRKGNRSLIIIGHTCGNSPERRETILTNEDICVSAILMRTAMDTRVRSHFLGSTHRRN